MTNLTNEIVDMLYVNKYTYEKLQAKEGKTRARNLTVANYIESEIDAVEDGYPLVQIPVETCKYIIKILKDDYKIKPIQKDEWHYYCGSCGKRLFLKKKARYCPKCGAKIDW